MPEILRCKKCGKYTLNENCSCGGKAVRVKPMKFSMEDKYSKYRVKSKLNVE